MGSSSRTSVGTGWSWIYPGKTRAGDEGRGRRELIYFVSREYELKTVIYVNLVAGEECARSSIIILKGRVLSRKVSLSTEVAQKIGLLLQDFSVP